ncbi:MAG: cation diffusion facilitator family transporter [Chloroflexota bacterium]
MSDIVRIRQQNIDPIRYRMVLRTIWIAVIGNGILALIKGGAAWVTGSTAVLAAAVDSITDLGYTGFLAWGLWLSQQPADSDHPQGHGRIEPLVSTVISLMMGFAGFEVTRRAIISLFGTPAEFNWGLPAVVLVISGLAKIVMYYLVRRVGKEGSSPAIDAFARDNLSDVLSSTAALIGVIAATRIHPLADPIAALVVAVWIFRNVWEILSENLGYLTGKAPPSELVDRIQSVAFDVEGVLGVHRVIADYVGPQLRVLLHVDLAQDITFAAAHDISEAVQDAVEAIPEVDLAHVHLEPIHQQETDTASD